MTTLRRLYNAMQARREAHNRVLDECPMDRVEPGRRIEAFLKAQLAYEEAVKREKQARKSKRAKRRTEHVTDAPQGPFASFP